MWQLPSPGGWSMRSRRSARPDARLRRDADPAGRSRARRARRACDCPSSSPNSARRSASICRSGSNISTSSSGVLTLQLRQLVRQQLLGRRSSSRMNLPYTIELTIAATIIGVLLGVPLGVAGGASTATRLPDSACALFSLVGYAVPDFYPRRAAADRLRAESGLVPDQRRRRRLLPTGCTTSSCRP